MEIPNEGPNYRPPGICIDCKIKGEDNFTWSSKSVVYVCNKCGADQ